ncbi:MAG: amino acid ABC transporter substrate-binding protein [Chloroflexota bacterium]
MKVKPASLLVIVILMNVIVASCAPAPTATPQPTKAPAATKAPVTGGSSTTAPEFIEIGASIPLTGKYASLGTMIKPGYEYAIADINAQGGVYVKQYDKKIPLRLTYSDDGSDPAKEVEIMDSLFAEKNLTAYLGGAGSDMHIAAAAVAENNQVPYCGVAFSLWKVHQQGYRYLFSPFPKSPADAKDVFTFLNEVLPEGERPTKVAIFSETTDWGNELGSLWEREAVTHGFEIVVHEDYAPGTKDFSDLIQKAKAAGAEALLALPNFPDGTTLFNQMSELGWAPKYSLIIRAADNVTWVETLGKTGDYIANFPGWHHALKFPGVEALNEKYQAEFGRPAEPLTGPAYACVQIFANAIELAGTLDRQVIRDAVSITSMTTVIGPVSFNPDGTGYVLNPMVQWQNGKLELIWPLDQATAPFLYPAPPFDQR